MNIYYIISIYIKKKNHSFFCIKKSKAMQIFKLKYTYLLFKVVSLIMQKFLSYEDNKNPQNFNCKLSLIFIKKTNFITTNK